MVALVKTIIVGQNETTKTGSVIGRGLVGGLFGPLGSIAGMATAKKKGYTSFLCIYDDGSKNVQTVKNGGMFYRIYMAALDVE